jgi:hypothetical protein
MADGIPTRDEMVKLLWKRAQEDNCKDSDRAKLCRVIAHLQGYNRSEDYSDLEEQLAELRARRPTAPEPEPEWYQRKQEH